MHVDQLHRFFHGKANFRVWRVANKAQAAALELVLIGGANRNLGCPSLICNEAKLMWWYEVAAVPENKYTRKLLCRSGKLSQSG